MNNKPATSLGSTGHNFIIHPRLLRKLVGMTGPFKLCRRVIVFANMTSSDPFTLDFNSLEHRLMTFANKTAATWEAFFSCQESPLRVSLVVAPFMSQSSSHPHDPWFNRPLPPADKPSNTNPGTPTQTHTQIHTHPVHNLYSISLSSHLLGIPVT